MAHSGQSELYETLRRRGVSLSRLDRIAAWSSEKLFEVFESTRRAIREPSRIAQGPFNFVANDSLSGAAIPFATRETRLEKVTHLARFAALYADTLLIRDPFDHYPHASVARDEHGSETLLGRGLEPGDFSTPALRLRFIDDLRLLLTLQPLITAGIVDFASSSSHWCPSCIRALQDRGELHKVISQPDELAWQRRIAKVVKRIEHTFLKQGTTVVHQHGDHAHASMFLPAGLLEYDQAQFNVELPKRLAAKALEPLNLNLRDARSLGLFLSEIERIVDDISTQNAAANRFECQYITDRALDLELMNLVSDAAAKTFNRAAVDALTHPVAFVDSVPLPRILKLRRQDGDAFLVYRDAIRKLLATSSGKTAKELREEFDDEVRPELNRIDRTLRNARKLLSVAALADTAIIFASVSIAAFSGLLPSVLGVPPELINVGAALGGWQGARSLASKLSTLRTIPKEVAENKFAFLWKLGRHKHVERANR